MVTGSRMAFAAPKSASLTVLFWLTRMLAPCTMQQRLSTPGSCACLPYSACASGVTEKKFMAEAADTAGRAHCISQ